MDIYTSTDKCRPFQLPLLVLLVVLMAVPPPVRGACGPGSGPGATLLIPYFEVDLENPQGRTTLISINTADVEPVVARVTLWTNLAVPTLVFDIVLQADVVRTMDLRAILQGDLPASDGNEAFSRCVEPVAEDPPAHTVEAMQAMHTGASPLRDGNCFSLPADEPALAVGYITVDAMNDCNPIFTYPGDPAEHFGHQYFESGGTGLASNRNVLWGDVFYIDPGGDAAMGIAAHALSADAESFETFGRTFYSGLGSNGDDREPLASTYRTRFFNGGAFDGESDVILWLDPSVSLVDRASGFNCDQPEFLVDFCQFLTFRVFNEGGGLLGEQTVRESQPLVRRMLVGGEDLPTPVNFGYFEIENQLLGACPLIPTGFEPLQAAAVTVLRAEGRFSAALEGVALDACP